MDKPKESKRETWKTDFPELAGQIDDAIEKYGEDELAVCDTRAGGAIFRTPAPADYNRFMSSLLSDKADVKAAAATQLARACVVYPEKQVFASTLDKYPAIATAVLQAITKLAGAELGERGKG